MGEGMNELVRNWPYSPKARPCPACGRTDCHVAVNLVWRGWWHMMSHLEYRHVEKVAHGS